MAETRQGEGERKSQKHPKSSDLRIIWLNSSIFEFENIDGDRHLKRSCYFIIGMIGKKRHTSFDFFQKKA